MTRFSVVLSTNPSVKACSADRRACVFICAFGREGNHVCRQISSPIIFYHWFYSNFFNYSESESHSVVSDSLQPHGLYSPWNSPGQNTGVGRLPLPQGIFPTQGSNYLSKVCCTSCMVTDVQEYNSLQFLSSEFLPQRKKAFKPLGQYRVIPNCMVTTARCWDQAVQNRTGEREEGWGRQGLREAVRLQ